MSLPRLTRVNATLATHVLLVCNRQDSVHCEALRLTHSQHAELVQLAKEVRKDARHVPIHWHTSKVRVVVYADSVAVSWAFSELEWYTQLMCQRTHEEL